LFEKLEVFDRFVYEWSSDSDVEPNADSALYVIISRTSSGALAECVARLNQTIAIFAVCRIPPAFSHMQIDNLYASSLTKQYWLSLFFLST
jgi:hypothetical protein